MTANTDARLAPSQRLSRGLKYTAVGPVDITRGVIGIGARTVQATASELHKRYESGKLRRQFAAAAQAVAALPEIVQAEIAQETAPAKRRRRPLLIAAVAAAVLAGERWRSRSSGGRCAPSRHRYRRVSRSHPSRSPPARRIAQFDGTVVTRRDSRHFRRIEVVIPARRPP